MREYPFAFVSLNPTPLQRVISGLVTRAGLPLSRTLRGMLGPRHDGQAGRRRPRASVPLYRMRRSRGNAIETALAAQTKLPCLHNKENGGLGVAPRLHLSRRAVGAAGSKNKHNERFVYQNWVPWPCLDSVYGAGHVFRISIFTLAAMNLSFKLPLFPMYDADIRTAAQRTPGALRKISQVLVMYKK
jgi:hypothetical protein